MSGHSNRKSIYSHVRISNGRSSWITSTNRKHAKAFHPARPPFLACDRCSQVKSLVGLAAWHIQLSWLKYKEILSKKIQRNCIAIGIVQTRYYTLSCNQRITQNVWDSNIGGTLKYILLKYLNLLLPYCPKHINHWKGFVLYLCYLSQIMSLYAPQKNLQKIVSRVFVRTHKMHFVER